MKTTFTPEELAELGLPYEALAYEDVEELRWGTRTRCVFLGEDGLHWAVDWYKPATEAQEGQDEWFEVPVRAYRVEPRTVTIEVWEPVEEES